MDVSAKNSFDAIRLNYETAEGESFYGFGEQFSYLDFKSRKVPILVSEQGQGRHRPDLSVWPIQVRGDWWTTYAPIPHYITKHYTSMLLYNNEYSEFDQKEDTKPSVSVWANNMDGEISWSDSYKGLIKEYANQTGKPHRLPSWVHKGAVMGTMGGTTFVRALHKKLKDRGAKLSSYWLQDWVGTRVVSERKRLIWVWLADHILYPDWDKLRSDMEAENIQMMGYFNTFVVDPNKLQEPVSPEQKALHLKRQQYFKEVVDNDFLIKRENGNLYYFDSGDFKAHFIDLSNPKAVSWLKEKMKQEIKSEGFKGWMADFGEAVPFDGVFHSGISGEEYHNYYPVQWAKINREIATELGMDDTAVIFHRSGFRGSQKYANLFWAGDQTTTWDEYDGFRSSIIGLLNGGLSGMAINHSDIGGYTNFLSPMMRSDELQARWIEANAFSPILRTHEGLTPEDNAQIYSSEFNLEFFTYFTKVYETLWDYRKAIFEEAHNTGLPAMRHMMIEFPNDKKSYDMNRYQYLFGPDLLVAPVVEKSAKTRKVYLPGENIQWVDFWTGKSYKSKKEILVESPLGRIPVFYRSTNKTLRSASQKSRTIKRNYERTNRINPICLPGYTYKMMNGDKVPCKEIN